MFNLHFRLHTYNPFQSPNFPPFYLKSVGNFTFCVKCRHIGLILYSLWSSGVLHLVSWKKPRRVTMTRAVGNITMP